MNSTAAVGNSLCACEQLLLRRNGVIRMGTSLRTLIRAVPVGPAERPRGPNADRCRRWSAASDALLHRRIYRAYMRLQRARVDGRYEAIVKWAARMDARLDQHAAFHALIDAGPTRR